ncbi:MAG: hypothetical protein ACE5K9_06520 [Candidatus Methylomirabilales bacterium]
MRKILGVVVLVVTLLAPIQIVLAEEHYDTFFPVVERLKKTQMMVEKAEMMMMKKMMKSNKKMSRAKMQQIMNMLDEIDREIQKLIEFGDE